MQSLSSPGLVRTQTNLFETKGGTITVDMFRTVNLGRECSEPAESAQCVPQIVAQQAIKGPRHTALVGDSIEITYSQLDARANQLAHHLQTLGVGDEVLVGICMSRSPLNVVAALAVLKSGGAYLPIDPSYP